MAVLLWLNPIIKIITNRDQLIAILQPRA